MGTKKEYHWEFRLFYLWWSQSREPDLRAGPGAGPLHWLQLWPISTGSGFGSATLDTIPIKIGYFLCRIRIGPFQYKSQNLAPFHPNLIKGDQRRSGCEHTEYWKKKKSSLYFVSIPCRLVPLAGVHVWAEPGRYAGQRTGRRGTEEPLQQPALHFHSTVRWASQRFYFFSSRQCIELIKFNKYWTNDQNMNRLYFKSN